MPDDFRKYVPRLVPQILASIESSQINDWNNSRRPGIGSAISESQRLELILKCVRSLRGTLSGYLHILVPALVKLADSLVNPAISSGSSNIKNNGQARLAVLAIQTMSILLQTTDGTVGATVTRALHEAVTPTTGSLPARAAQPLMRMLSKESNANKAVGLVTVEAICVCAKQLGRSRWMPFYHLAARESIVQWEERVGLSYHGSSQYEIKQEDGRENLAGLPLYDEMVKELILPPQRSSVLASLQAGEFSTGDNQLRAQQSSMKLNETSGPAGFDASELEGDLPPPSIQPIPNQTKKHRVNQANLQRSWETSQRSTREDWVSIFL